MATATIPVCRLVKKSRRSLISIFQKMAVVLLVWIALKIPIIHQVLTLLLEKNMGKPILDYTILLAACMNDDGSGSMHCCKMKM